MAQAGPKTTCFPTAPRAASPVRRARIIISAAVYAGWDIEHDEAYELTAEAAAVLAHAIAYEVPENRVQDLALLMDAAIEASAAIRREPRRRDHILEDLHDAFCEAEDLSVFPAARAA